ncbi:MAG: GAF domain-containing protein [Bacteroidota bacterium]
MSVSQNDLPLLLHKDLEQTIALHGLESRSQRVHAGLAITESVSRQLNAHSALLALGRETLSQLGMAAALIAEEGPEGPRLLHALGSIPRATNVEALFGQRNPLRVVLQTGQPILAASLDENEEWRDSPLLTSLRAKGMICLPLMVENRAAAAMLAVSAEPIAAFTDEDRKVYYQISRQTSVILQNISLLNETRRRLQEVDLLLDFSRRLGGLNADEMLAALLSSALRVLHSAHAGAVFLWDVQAGQLEPRCVSGYVDNESLMRIAYRSGEALPGSVFESGQARRVGEVDFARDYALSPENLVTYRQGTGGRLPVSSLLVPILRGSQALGLIVLDNFNTTAAFKPEDEALLVSLAQQIALSLENIRLVEASQERAGQLEALNESATSMTASLRSEELVDSLLEQLQTILPYDTATLWLRDKDRLTVAAASGFPDSERRLGLALAVSDSALFNEIAATGHAMAVGDVREDPRFPRVEVPRLSWLGIPLIAKGGLAGVIALEKWQADFYNSDYIQLATAFASQAIVSLENARLYEDSLQRAAELDERTQRLVLLNRFSSQLSGLLDADQILRLTAEEMLHALGAERVSAVAAERGQAVWRLSVPPASVELPEQLPDAPIFDRLRESRGVFKTSDIAGEPDLAPLSGFLGDTASLLVVPVISGAEMRALLFAHAAGSVHFELNEIDLARTIANQAAIALENARLYQDTVRTAERFSILHQSGAEISASLESEQIYASVHRAAERVMPVESFVISLLDEATRELQPVYVVGRGEYIPPTTPLGRSDSVSRQVFQSGEPALLNLSADQRGKTGILPPVGASASVSALAVPMTMRGRVLGVLSAQSYRPNAYTQEDMQILGTLASQAIVAIQNGRLFAETQRLAQEMEQRVIDRTAQLQREQQNTETLLHILTEVSSSLDLDRALNRTLALLNDATGAEQGTIMLLQADDNLLHYRAGYGYLSEALDPSNTHGFTLKVGEGMAGWVVQNREAVLAEDLQQHPYWVRSLGSGQEHRSSVIAPLLVGDDVIGVLMIFHRAPQFFGRDILNMVKAIAAQVAVAINNARLYELIRDQAERLGVMLRKEQEDASRSQAILEAVADGVLVTGVDNTITFANASIERIVDVHVDRIMNRPLESIGALFGRSAMTWMDTIRHWSESPPAHEAGETYAEQLELGSGRVALIHLAPVIFQNDFLGTVSIFRDITHEVEVDRLKSEFVATVSHELRTPMTSIKGYIDILLMGAAGAFNEKQQHFIEIVQSNAERLNVLVNDLLDISRIEAGQITIDTQPVDLRAMAQRVVDELRQRSQEECKPMDVSLAAPERLPPVLADAERVHQILANLLDNAYHYTPENGSIRVQLSALDGKEVRVDIADTGVGIALQDQPRVFERFYRGEHPLVIATPGTGLGLTIVRELVEMHHGRIWMNSKGVPGEGTTFSFTLPAQGTD